MKKLLLLPVFLLAIVLSAVAQKIEPLPNPPRAVNDFGNMLEPFQQSALEQKLRAYNDSTSSAIVIITVPDLQGYDIAQVALKYLREWGVGSRDKNNGVVILVSQKERRARIETGYGMEGVLPDILAKHIIDDEMIPYFRENDYYRGFDRAVDAIIKAATGEYKADPRDNDEGGGWILAIVIIIIIFLIIGGFGRGGGKGGQYMSWRGSDTLSWLILNDLLNNTGRGSSGGFDGGGFGGGGFGGGGFGGFGGGSGGGGGASGGW